ncbi:GGDEF domain-containing response regulator [Sulfurimonas sp. CVO]|uniref:EAL domain-containing response regulator n=1 Tax=Sulfurimonas sp. CVO TaxID=2283483 RepID=UPI00132F2BE8|nr:EAL domain-containing response regulator [Sulfurimonas sp. CVO]QHG92020.1 GGDEF domain-containing response regulator [Sulfurimonas sp. CVO]
MNVEFLKEIRLLGNTMSVLIVEDEEDIREHIAKILSKLFHKVSIACDGSEALLMYETDKYDIIITDLKMQKKDGLELSKEILQTDPDQQIIIVSAYKENDKLLELINMGIAGFLIKPVDIDIMLEKIYTIMKNIYSKKIEVYHFEEMKQQFIDSTASENENRHIDILTGLYNYKYLIEYVKEQKVISAVLININDFKLINDYYSFSHGNKILYQVAEFIKEKSQKLGYMAFKLQSDEFVLVKNEPTGECKKMIGDVKEIYSSLEERRFSAMGIHDIFINVTVSIISNNSQKVLESLHQTLAYAKKNGLKYAFYKDVPDNSKNMKNIMHIKNLLHQSIKDHLVTPFYQPIMTKESSLKYEVLMRIKNPINPDEYLQPAQFLEIAKRHSFYNEISRMVIFDALNEMINKEYSLSINFSYADINNSAILEKLKNKIIEHNLAERLIFEIVETEKLENLESVKAFIDEFKSMGVKIAIDDFGSGYSNFAYLFSLEPDYIKLDGSLISKVLLNKKISLFVQTIIDFAHKLEVEVIAEHISSKELYDKLQNMGVDGMQGYFIGYPQKDISEIFNAV